jgi:spore coat polysaccharide biosynthesis predicted glycosyltransferase SpsG
LSARGEVRILIRAVASQGVGAGHVARTWAVAREFIDRGIEVHWACDASTLPYLEARNVGRTVIHVLASAATEGRSGERELPIPDQQRDSIATIKLAAQLRISAVLIDTYLLGAPWQRAIRNQGLHVFAFDDMMDRAVDADVVVNAAGSAQQYRTLAPGARALCGLEFAVTSSQPSLPPPPVADGNLLIAFGASDLSNMSARVLQALAAARADEGGAFEAWVQLGSGAPHRSQVQSQTEGLGWARMLNPQEAIDASRRRVTTAIGASGVSLYERMRDGIPGVVIPLADNQLRIAEVAATCGAAMIASSPVHAVTAALELRRSEDRLRFMSAAGRSAVDDRGAQRVADIMLACCK